MKKTKSKQIDKDTTIEAYEAEDYILRIGKLFGQKLIPSIINKNRDMPKIVPIENNGAIEFQIELNWIVIRPEQIEPFVLCLNRCAEFIQNELIPTWESA